MTGNDDVGRFERVLGPLGLFTFMSTYWANRPVCIQKAFDVADYPKSSDVDFLLTSLSRIDRDWVQVVREGRSVTPDRFVGPDGVLDLTRIYAAYGGGFTVQLAKMQLRNAVIGELARAAERGLANRGIALERMIGSHLYLTPANSRGLSPHVDDHDVFVLQLAGTKYWRVSPTLWQRESSAAPSEAFSRNEYLSYKLEPGDMLYVPKYFVHDAHTESDSSIHITLDVYEGERALPSPITPMVDSDVSGANTAGSNMVPLGAGGFRHSYPLPSDGFRSLDRIKDLSADQVVMHRRGANPILVSDSLGASLVFAGGCAQCDVMQRDVLAYIAEHARFIVRDISSAMSDSDKIKIIVSLIKSACLEIQ